MKSNYTVTSAAAHATADQLTSLIAALNAISFHVRSHFYLVKPSEAMFENYEDVPNFQSSLPFFVTMVFAEWFILWFKKKPLPPLTDIAASGIMGLIHEVLRLMFRGLEYSAYVYVYQHYRIYELPWDSVITWYVAAILTDFGYYWGHRATHEINVLWAYHQAHHSSEYYALISGLRLGAINNLCHWIFYIPMALFMPPAQFILHHQLNLMHQFWVHTELIENLGPLEYILNTPSHHRVHHGSNDYCLDRNYGAVLIIWDRMFGTFAAERKGEPIVYGLVDPVESVNPIYLEVFYFGKIYEKFWSAPGWINKIKTLLCGPAWQPGSPRLGWEDKLPGVKPRTKFYVPMTFGMAMYAFPHYVLMLLGFMALHIVSKGWSLTMVWLHSFFIIASFMFITFVYERKSYGAICEFIRCLTTYVLIDNFGLPLLQAVEPVAHIMFSGQSIPNIILVAIKTIFMLSTILWGSSIVVHKYQKIMKVKET